MPKHFVGLDVSLDQTSLCVLNEAGHMISETKVLNRAGFVGGSNS